MDVIIPKPISGFPEWLPQERILEQKLMDIIRFNFERHGFVPIETSAVERTEILSAKGGNDKEIYTIKRLAGDEGDDSNLALHFDLTVPLARYVAQNYSQLFFPFRRYQIQKVWRGERPQSGRFREFYQCDIDAIGDGELSLLTDAEMPSIIFRIFKEMNIGPFVIQINNRKILQGYFQSLGIAEDQSVLAMRVADKLEKIGEQRVTSELVDSVGLSADNAQKLIDFISLEASSNSELIKLLRKMQVNDCFVQGVDELSKVIEYIGVLGVPEDNCSVNISIARGLDYYTGTVYETVLKNHPGIGSICSGGRFENLASYFTDKKLPGVGISIGLTRLFSRLLKAGILQAGSASTASVLITAMDATSMPYYFKVATMLRDQGVNTEVFLESKKLGAQLKYANRIGCAFAIIAGSTEVEKDSVQLKNLKTGEQQTVLCNDIPKKVTDGLEELSRKDLY